MGNRCSKLQCFGIGSTAHESPHARGSASHPVHPCDGSVVDDRGSDPKLNQVHGGIGSSSVHDNGSSSVPESVVLAVQDNGPDPKATQLLPPSSLQAPPNSSRDLPSLSQSLPTPSPAPPTSSEAASTSSPAPSASLSQASTNNPSSEVAFTVKEIADLEKILEYVQKVIDRHKVKSDSQVVIQEVVSSNVKEADLLLDRLSKEFQQKPNIADVAAEARRTLPHVLAELSHVHWAATGVSMLAFISSRLNQMHKNTEDCLDILGNLADLSRDVVRLLKENFPDAQAKLYQAISLICEAAIWCDKQLESKRSKRFLTVNIAGDYIQGLQSRVNHLYRDLTVALGTQTVALGTQTLTQVKIMHRQTTLPLKPFKASYPSHAVGLEKKVSEVLQLLRVRGTENTMEFDVRAILLYGIGGIGKTTLGKAVCAEIPITGRSVAQVEVGANPTKERICAVQMEIYERLTGTKQQIGNYEEGQKMVQEHLSASQAPVLLFIDNVFHRNDLKNLLSRELVLPARSRLVVTSRYMTVPDFLDKGNIRWEKYSVPELAQSDSRLLFDYHLGGCPPDKDLKEQVDTIVKICGGLPLALEVVGSHLRASDHEDKLTAWNSAIDSLREFQNIAGGGEDELNPVLRWSYELLTQSSKRLFLDICCLLRNAAWDWIECLDTRSDLKFLKDISLVQKVEESSKTDGFSLYASSTSWGIQVHDLLAALGRHICDKSFPRTRLSFNSPKPLEKFSKLDPQDCCGIEGLVVDYYTETPTLPAGILDAAHESLRVLVLHGGVHVQGMCSQHLIPRELQICSTWISRREGLTLCPYRPPPSPWKDKVVFPYTDISCFNQLRLLDIEGDVALDFKDVKFPQSLKIVQLQEVDKLYEFHSNAFKECTSLHTLHITRCCNLKGLPRIRLGKLVTVNLRANVQLHTLSDLDGLIELRTLNLSTCWELEALPDKVGSLKNLKKLDMSGCARLGELPNEFGNLIALEELQLDECTRLEKLPDSLGGLVSLQELYLGGCENLETLPHSIGSLKNLRKLDMSRCSRLEELPNEFGNLSTLESVVLCSCVGLEKLPDTFGNLTALKNLQLDGCMHLEKLPDSFGGLLSLQKLDLGGCEKLKGLPHCIGSLKNLRELCMERSRLAELPNEFGNLTALEKLWLDGCTHLEKLPDSFGGLASLKELDLGGCKNLETLPHSICSLKNLRKLDMSGCTKLGELRNEFGNLITLENVVVYSSTELEKPRGTFGDLVSLKFGRPKN